MNQRIQELAEQAHSYACKYAQQPDYNPHNPYNQGMYKQRYDSKFAELIVAECLSMCDETQAVYYKHRLASLNFTDKNRYAAGETAADTIYTKIKLHFGVEE